MALESFPPLILISTRFLLSGSILLAVSLLRGGKMPRGSELWKTALYGLMILGIGNSALTFAELWIPSGLAALFITTSPFWMVGIEAALPGGERLHGPTVAGMLVGFLGTALLVGPDAFHEGVGSSVLKGFLVLQFGCAGWALGSILQRREGYKTHPFISGAIQQIAAGAGFLIPALLVKSQPITWSWRGTAAFIYLVTFGSLVGYSSYVYSLARLPVAVVSIYGYVNPVVAVFLGWLIYAEPFGKREMLAMLVIFAGVAVVKWTTSESAKASPSQAPSRPALRRPKQPSYRSES
jgi:Permeases of the drug/metabolite transporter (DMT) superfamily